ncbi:hypothetical protein V2J09_012338 [Rumex salicifolius]
MTSRLHVAVCPFPFTSHAALMLLLSRKIAASAPADLQISFFTTASSAAGLKLSPEEEAGGGGGSIRVRHVDEGGAAALGAHPVEAIKALVAGESLGKAVAEAEEDVGVKISCVVADAMMTFACRRIAEERAVKWVAMWAPSAGALAAHMHTDLLRNSVGNEAHKGAKVDQYISGYPPISINDLPHEVLAVDDPIGQILHVMSHHLSEAATVIINSFQSLEPAATDILNAAYPDKFLCAGPFALTLPKPSPTVESDPHGCLPWLDAHTPASVVYISFGSGHTPPLEEFASLAEALEAARVPFLWSIPDRFRSHLPEKTTGLGKLVSWAPQTAVLGHAAVGAQLTHGGWNSVLESIVSGVPMICRLSRSIADHAFNGRMVVEPDLWGIGVEVEGQRLTKAATMAALDRVMVGEEAKRIRKNIGELKRLAEEAVAEPNGSSAKSLSYFIDIITS